MILIKDTISDRMLVDIKPETYKFSVHSWMCKDQRCWLVDWCTGRDLNPRWKGILCKNSILLDTEVVDGTEIW